ncbi:MAG: FdtA/QdtA family cupin domain-containing protein [Mucilaginibacter sp.]|uniref:sugar 3,4-ketoisomerase n=1 Tax=Mucilaginibacter sp. TaxID=1882438 RepID=UPI003264887B
MAYIIDLDNYKDERGTLTVIDHVLPFKIKRSYYITDLNHLERGGHRHLELVEGIIALHGSFTVGLHDGTKRQEIVLDNPHQCLIIEVGEWHHFYNFSLGAILLSLASTHYDHSDYIYEPYS